MHAPQEAQEHLQIKAGLLNATAEAPAQTQKTLSQASRSRRRTSSWKEWGIMKTQTSGLLLQLQSSHYPEKISKSNGNLSHSHRESTTPQRQQWLKCQKGAAGLVQLGPVAASLLHHWLVSVVTMPQQDHILDQEAHISTKSP